MIISDLEYQQLVKFIHQELGIFLGSEKHSLLLNRLQPLMVKQGFSSFKKYYDHLRSDVTGNALLTLANRITTNYSFFFREEGHFNFLCQHTLPNRIREALSSYDATLNFWSAGCSAGEEAYSLSIMLQNFFGDKISKCDLGILATDIDTAMLNKAHKAVYSKSDLKGVPPLKLKRYFNPIKQDFWQVKPEIRKPVHFSRFNLVNSHFSFKKKFFVIFCRNVMIYFDRQTIQKLVERFYQVTENNGYLIIGQTESLDKKNCPFEYVAPSIYKKKK